MFEQENHHIEKQTNVDLSGNQGSAAIGDHIDKQTNIYHYHPAGEKPALKHQLSLIPTYDKERFVGRETFIGEIMAVLETGNRVAISGMAGLGKSEIGKKILADFGSGYDYIGWISYSGNFAESVYGSMPGCGRAGEPTFEGNRNHIMGFWNRIGKNALIIVDNVNREKSEDAYLELIENPEFNVIVTTKQKKFGIYTVKEISYLDDTDCMKLFSRFYEREYEEKLIGEIVKKLGSHTFFIKTVAKAAQADRKSLAGLLDKLNADGFDLSKAKLSDDWDDNKTKQTIADYIPRMFDVSGLTENEKLVLRALSLTPDQTVTEEIKEWLNLESYEEFNELCRKGWFDESNDGFYMHGIMKTVIRRLLAPTADNCGALIKSLTKRLSIPSGKYFRYVQDYVVYGKEIAIALESEQSEDFAAMLNNLSGIYQDTGEYEKALKFQKMAVAIRERVLAVDHPNLGVSYSHLSLIYNDMKEYESALKFQIMSSVIFKEVLGKTHPYLANAYNNLSLIYRNMKEYDYALTFQNMALYIRAKILEPYHPDLATSYNNLSQIYIAIGDYELALELQIKAVAINKIKLEPEHPALGLSFLNLGINYYVQGDYSLALEWVLKAYEIFQKKLPYDHPYLAESYKWLAYIFDKLGDQELAAMYHQKYMEISRTEENPQDPD